MSHPASQAAASHAQENTCPSPAQPTSADRRQAPRRRSTRAARGSPPRSPRSSWRGRCCSPPRHRSRRRCSPPRRRSSRSAPSPGCSTRRTPGCSAPSSGPASGRRRELEDPAPPRFAQAVGLGFALVGAARLPRRRRPPSALVATGFALVAALLNAAFGFCLGCEMYLLLKRADRPCTVDTAPARPRPPTEAKKGTHMSRDTALVSADWAEENLDDPTGRLRRGRRGHHRLRQRPHPGRRQARLEDRPAGPGPPRLRQQGAVRGAAVRARHRQRRHRRAVRRQQQLVRRLRVLVLQALRPRRRQAARRRPQEVGARRAAS